MRDRSSLGGTDRPFGAEAGAIGALPQQAHGPDDRVAERAHVALAVDHVAAGGIGHKVMRGVVGPLFGVFGADARAVIAAAAPSCDGRGHGLVADQLGRDRLANRNGIAQRAALGRRRASV